MYYTALLLAAAGSVTYHLSMKQMPGNLNPFFSLAISYAMALALCLLGMMARPDEQGSMRLAELNWSVVGLALGIVGIEVGFLLAYRSGWHIGLASISSNALATMVLLPVGLVLFRESLTPDKFAGAGLALAGLWLMMRS